MAMRREHQHSGVLAAPLWCNKCKKETPHAVAGHKIGHCIPCADKLEPNYKPPTPYKASGQPVHIDFPCYCLAHPYDHWHTDGKRYNLGAIDHRFQKKEKKA